MSLCKCGCGRSPKNPDSQFCAGHNAIGQKHSEETRRKMRASRKGKPKSKEWRENIGKAHLGKKRAPFSEEWKRKIKLAVKGRKLNLSEEQRRKRSENNIGEKNPSYGKVWKEERRKERSIRYSGKGNPNYGKGLFGEKNPNWNGGNSHLPYAKEFEKIRLKIKERDEYSCQNPKCEGISNKLHVHHIDFDKLNIDPVYLITLCNRCHLKKLFKKKKILDSVLLRSSKNSRNWKGRRSMNDEQLLGEKITKYRVWDKLNQKMIYPDGLYGDEMGEGTEIITLKIAGEMNGASDEFQEQFELMEFTNLYDSDDKEVYEGDILLFTDYNEYGVVYWDLGEIGNPNAKVNAKKIGANNMNTSWMCYRYKIVGNVFETPSVTTHEDFQI